MAKTNTSHLISAIYSVKGWELYKQTINKSGKIVSQVYKTQVREGNKVVNMTRTLKKGNETLSKTMVNATNKQNDLTKALRRAAIVAPIWLALRSVMMKVLEAIKDIITTYKELDISMRKVMAVTNTNVEEQGKIYAELEQRAKAYFASTSRSIKEVTESMYQLGTAGRSNEEIMKGFEHVMNLAIGTFGEVTTSGRVVAGILNVFESSLKKVGGTSEQLRYISDLLASAWKNNQIELNELNTAMGYLSSIGSALDMTLQELVASSSVMSDALLRGGKGGRLLARSFVEIAKDSKKLRDLGVIFDPYKPLNFYNVMKQLHNIYVKSAGSMGFVNDLVDIFGVRGVRAVLSVLQQWDKFNKELNRSPEEIKGTAEELKNLAEGSWWSLLQKRWHQTTMGIDRGTGRSSLKEMLAANISEEDKFRKQVSAISSSIELLGKEISITKDEAKSLWAILEWRGGYNIADNLKKAMGLTIDESVFDIEKESGMKALNRIAGQLKSIEGMGLSKHIRTASTEKFEPSDMVMEGLMSRYNSYTKNIITNVTEANKFMTDLVSKGKNAVDITEEEWQQLAEIAGYDKSRLPILKRAVELRLEELKASNNAIISSSALGRIEKENLRVLKEGIKYETLRIKGYSEASVLIEQITNEVKRQNEIIGEYNRENLADQKELITVGDILSNNMEKLKASAIERADIEQMLKLSKQTAIAFAEEEQNIVKTIIAHELDLLKIRGASNKQVAEQSLIYERQFYGENRTLELLSKKLEVEKEITKEKLGQVELSSETMKLYQIAQKYGLQTANVISRLVESGFNNNLLSQYNKKYRNIAEEYFSTEVTNQKAREFFYERMGRYTSIPERTATKGSRSLADITRRANNAVPNISLGDLQLPSIVTKIDKLEINIKQGIAETLKENKISQNILNALAEAIRNDSKIAKAIDERIEKY